MADAARTRRQKKTVGFAEGARVFRWVVKAQPQEAHGEGAAAGGASAAAGGSASDAGSADTSALTHTVAGDSSHLSEHDEDEADEETAPALSAEQVEPPAQQARVTVVVRDTVPPDLFCDRRASDPIDRPDNVGNISLFFQNWGAMPGQDNAGLRRRVFLQVRHCPGLIVTLAECDAEMERILQMPGVPPPRIPVAPAAAGAGATPGDCPAPKTRPAFQ